ncbi:hypothetical protein SEA_TOMAS_213 [Streptomyces phage Tomas]|uniref:Uncharacterized protein n=1 Tax=Streptomyces phage Tomas TaxID=2914443 RepID=A0AA49BT50_9CAUD|nr:hypothetical protein PP453_gp107 [Streptomyces phage Tomas]UMO76360.1 hypothetical protein SEA_TOMAS_213 [Streptomyces phage Tomas]
MDQERINATDAAWLEFKQAARDASEAWKTDSEDGLVSYNWTAYKEYCRLEGIECAES